MCCGGVVECYVECTGVTVVKKLLEGSARDNQDYQGRRGSVFKVNLVFLSFFLVFRGPNLITGLSRW